jgi:chaperone BCS1
MEELLGNIVQGNKISSDTIIFMIVSLYGVTIVMFLFKSIPQKIIEFILYHFTTKLFISSMDSCYFSLVKLFQENNIVCKARSLRFMNGRYGGSEKIDKSIGSGSHYLFYKGWPIKINYNIEKTLYDNEKIHITLTKLGRSHKLFDELRKELQNLIKNENEPNKLIVYNFNRTDHIWQLGTKIIKRNFDTIFIEEDIKKRLLNHLDNFYAKEKWYYERGIPYQTGICLHGPAGTGKTSIVKGLASYYNKSICILRSSELDDLPHALKQLPSDSFIVIEDIDTSSIVMEREPKKTLEESLYTLETKSNRNEGVTVDSSDIPALYGRSNKNNKANNDFNQDALYTKVLLSDVLNAMDGIISIEKRVIVFTTNHIEKLDRALIRPGRIDCIEKIDYISYNQFKRFCTLFYKETITEDDMNKLNTVYSTLKETVTVAELQKNFMQGMKIDEMMALYCK